MGIYFIAAGVRDKVKNRLLTLDRGHRASDIAPYVPSNLNLFRDVPSSEFLYAWGANDGASSDELSKVKPWEYVVDVKNKTVVQVFRFWCGYRTRDTSLQEYFGWDGELPKEERRLYEHVFFLRHPVPTIRTEKEFFQHAFKQSSQYWLTGQKYFDDEKVAEALRITECPDVETLLGIPVMRRGPTSTNDVVGALQAAAIGAPSGALHPILFRPEDVEDRRVRTLRAIVERQGQGEFRRRLIELYEGKCAITGCDALPALEAAHIVPYFGPETNHPCNGLLLRADIHTLFDLGLLAIDEESLSVLIAASLRETAYAELEGKLLRVPGQHTLGPSRDALARHRAQSGLVALPQGVG